MATNENEIGVKAKFDLEEFKKNFDQYVARLDKANAETEGFYKKQEAASNKAAAASKASADKQAVNLRQVERMYKQAVTSMIVLFGGIVAAYKFLEDESKRLGDEETVAGFTALEESATNLKDSLAAMVVEALPIADVLKFVAGGVTALTQVLTLAGAAVTWFGTLFAGSFDIIGKRIEEMKQGKIFTSGMNIGAEFSALNVKANQAANNVIVASVKAPEQVKTTENEKEAEKKRVKDIADYQQKIRDLQIKSGESVLAALEDQHSKEASAWADYMDKSAEIIADGVKKRAELLTTYQDAIRKAESDYQRESETTNYNHGKKLADIARDYQNEVRRINEDFGKEALDAARNLDAIAFVRAKEKRDSALQDAAQNRDQANADENENYSRQLFELQRNLEDKKREAEVAYQRGLDDQRKAEQDAQNSAKENYNKQISDARQAFDDKLAAIRASYANEDAEAAAHYLNQETMFAAHLQAMQALMSAYNIVGTGTTSPGGVVGGGTRRRAAGGLDMVSSPTQFIAGDAGPEMVLTLPMNRNVPAPMVQTVNHTGDFSHQIDSTIRSSVAGMDGRITAAIRKAIGEVLG